MHIEQNKDDLAAIVIENLRSITIHALHNNRYHSEIHITYRRKLKFGSLSVILKIRKIQHYNANPIHNVVRELIDSKLNVESYKCQDEFKKTSGIIYTQSVTRNIMH